MCNMEMYAKKVASPIDLLAHLATCHFSNFWCFLVLLGILFFFFIFDHNISLLDTQVQSLEKRSHS